MYRQLGAQRTRPTSASSTTSSHRSSTALSPALFPTSLTSQPSLPDDSNQPLSLSPVPPKRSSYGHPPKTESPTSLIPFTSRFFGAHGSTRDVREGVRVLHESLGSHLKELDLVAAVLVRRINSEESAAKACEESVAALVPSLMELHQPASILPTLSTYATTLSQMAAAHRLLAERLSQNGVAVIKDFCAKHRRLVDLKRTEVDSHYSVYLKSLQELEAKRAAFFGEVEGVVGKKEYLGALTTAEHARSAVEFHITEFLQYAQDTQHARLQLSREVFTMLEDAQTNFYHTQLQNWAPPSNQTTDDSDDEDSPTPVQTTKLASPDPLLGTQEIAHVLQTGTRHTQPILLDPIIPLCQCFGISLETLHQATSDPIPPFLRKCIASLHESLTLRKLKTPVDAWITGSAGLAQVPAIQFLRMEANGTCGGSGVHYSRVKREEPSVISALVKEFLGELPVGLVGTEVEETLRIVYDAYETVDMEEDDTIRLKTVSSLLLTLPTSHYETLKLLSHLLHITTKDLPDTSPKLFHLIRTLSPLILRAKIETTESLQDTLRDKLCYDLLRNYTDIFPALDDDPTDDHYNDRVFAPPTTPPPTDTFDDDDDIPNRGRHRISRNSTLFGGLVEGSKDVAEGAWRGLVKTVSGLNMNRAAATSAPQENVLFDSGVGGRRFTVGSPLSRGRESESGEEWALPGDMARRHTSSVDAAARRLGLDNFSDVEESEYEEDSGVRAVVCNWKGCGREFEGNKALMLHIAGVHMGHDGTSSGVVVVSNPASM